MFQANKIKVSFSKFEIYWHDRKKTMNSFGILCFNTIAHSLLRFLNVCRWKLNNHQYRRRDLLLMHQTLLRRGMLTTLKLLKPNISEQTCTTSDQYMLVSDFVCKFTMNTFTLMFTNTSKTILPQLLGFWFIVSCALYCGEPYLHFSELWVIWLFLYTYVYYSEPW